MSAPIQIQIRDRVELKVKSGDATIGVFTVRVQDIRPEGVIIDRPVIDQRLLPAEKGKAIEIVFQRQDATYRFYSSIIREMMLDRLPVLLIEAPREIERIQRREFFRLDLDLPLRYCKLSRYGGEAVGPIKTGKVINLSAGGVKFHTELLSEAELQLGDVLMFSFNLTNSYSVAGLEGRILIKQSDSRFGDRYTFACRFLNIPAYIQEAIVIHNIRHQQRYRVEPRGR